MKRIPTMLCGAALLLSMAGAKAETKNYARGDYIESRSASVYAGPCHYSGEATTDGRTATLAWRIENGAWNGVKLDGLNAVAVLSANDNLADAKKRRSALYLDARANAAQVAALRSMLTQKYSAVLGEIAAMQSAPVEIGNDGLDYRVRAGDAKSPMVQLDVNHYPCSHCTQDYQIWYQPFVNAQNLIVGKTTRTAFRDKALNTMWDDRQEANSAFVGTFAF